MRSLRQVLGRESVLYGGVSLRIVVAEGSEDRLFPDLSKGVLSVSSRNPLIVREMVRRWFLKETSAYAVKKVAELAPVVGVRPRRVDVREINKWGYCTRGGRLSFSWQLVALPERLREYVVLHELTHLVEFNHSPAFRKKLFSACPDFRERERELDRVLPYNRMSLP